MNRRLALQLAFCFPISAVLTGKYSTLAQAAAPLTIRSAINKSGRQRMLSQRLAKAWIMLGMNIAPDRARAILADSLQQFEAQLAELRSFTPNRGVREALGRQEKVWASYKSVLSHRPGLEMAATLYDASEAMQVAAHRTTLAYETSAVLPADRLVNIAGRQRMLSQRMAKFWLFEAWGVNARAARLEFTFTHEEFLSGMTQLRLSQQNSADIRAALAQLEGEWDGYRAALEARLDIPGKRRAAPDVVERSERVLAACEKIVSLYEHQGAA